MTSSIHTSLQCNSSIPDLHISYFATPATCLRGSMHQRLHVYTSNLIPSLHTFITFMYAYLEYISSISDIYLVSTSTWPHCASSSLRLRHLCQHTSTSADFHSSVSLHLYQTSWPCISIQFLTPTHTVRLQSSIPPHFHPSMPPCSYTYSMPPDIHISIHPRRYIYSMAKPLHTYATRQCPHVV